MDNGWSEAVVVGKLPEGDERPVVMDMGPAADPVDFWAGKRLSVDEPARTPTSIPNAHMQR